MRVDKVTTASLTFFCKLCTGLFHLNRLLDLRQQSFAALAPSLVSIAEWHLWSFLLVNYEADIYILRVIPWYTFLVWAMKWIFSIALSESSWLNAPMISSSSTSCCDLEENLHCFVTKFVVAKHRNFANSCAWLERSRPVNKKSIKPCVPKQPSTCFSLDVNILIVQ